MRLLAALLSLCAALAGCGGSGAPIPDAGNWSGAWRDATSTHRGPISFTIASDNSGSLLGQVTDLDLPNAETGTVTGSLSRNRNLQLVFTFPDKSQTTAYGQVSDTGGTLSGTIPVQSGVPCGIIFVDLTRP